LAGAGRANDPELLGRTVDEAIERLTGDIAALRALITDLRPAALDQLGAGAALEALAERLRQQSGVPIALSVSLGEGERHAPEVEDAIYRIIQEALTNALNHAAPEHMWVDVIAQDDHVE